MRMKRRLTEAGASFTALDIIASSRPSAASWANAWRSGVAWADLNPAVVGLCIEKRFKKQQLGTLRAVIQGMQQEGRISVNCNRFRGNQRRGISTEQQQIQLKFDRDEPCIHDLGLSGFAPQSLGFLLRLDRGDLRVERWMPIELLIRKRLRLRKQAPPGRQR